MLERALLVDAQGRPIAQHHKVFSNAWDEIKAWSSEVYMPYDVAPIGRHIAPASTMHSAKIGSITAPLGQSQAGGGDSGGQLLCRRLQPYRLLGRL